MAVVAYLRVSTEKQFLENQREEITAQLQISVAYFCNIGLYFLV